MATQKVCDNCDKVIISEVFQIAIKTFRVGEAVPPNRGVLELCHDCYFSRETYIPNILQKIITTIPF